MVSIFVDSKNMYITPDNFATMVAERCHSRELDTALHELLRESRGAAQIVIVDSNESYRISSTSEDSLSERLWAEAGCLSKLITGVTFFSVCGSSKESLSTRVVDLLGIDAPKWFSAITIEDLLNHTHGIDVDFWDALEHTGDGMIDVAKMLRGMSKIPLSPTGMYSYSNIGPRLLAAAVEMKVRRPFLQVAREVMGPIFEPSGADDKYCPALGGVRINVEQLLLHLVRVTTYANKLASRTVRLGQAYIQNYPGWHIFEQGICVGWKAYGRGWFGHVAANKVNPLCLRVSPSDGRGILVSSTGVFPQQLLTSLFSEALIGCRNKLPTKSAAMEPDQCVGIYTRGNNRLRISSTGSDLRLEAKRMCITQDAVNGSLSHNANLVRIPRSSMFAVTPVNTPFLLHFVEFVHDSQGVVTHLWNGACLWRKQSDHTDALS